MAIVLFEGIGQAESNNREARNVIRAGLVLFVETILILTMDVGNAGIWIMVSMSVWPILRGYIEPWSLSKEKYSHDISQDSAIWSKRGNMDI